jgi:serine/threonine-protein kinase
MREVNVGERLDQYQLVDVLARSGMASLFKAVDTESGAPVALKVPHMQFESDVVFFERFKREEEIGQKLDHPNLVKVLTPKHKSRMYLAMEFVEGQSLRAKMSHAGQPAPMPVPEALEIARQVADALAYLHDKKIVHRDLKPENILITAAGQVKILDFGIALDESKRRLTWVGLSSTVGTPDYMAPEQVGGRRGDARTDVYALGTILYEMITAHLPHTAANAHALLRLKGREDAQPPSIHLPGLDPGLEAIILQAIERSPRDRQATAAELLAQLRDPAAVPPRDPAAAAARKQGRLFVPRVWFLRATVVLVLVGLGALVWLSHRSAVDAPLRSATPAQQ